ncbi:hypothetical protein [Caballeronia humi]|uniref:Uncharacterized protein n=1 Tax=Caballeronia humi TaxID=326474 RepID=A0A158GSL2_9BURK|nr:hypothetical protein [Caballeronia humi]SAL34903.1 hypothetical protein AWB65_02436 [Caballeronia humi]
MNPDLPSFSLIRDDFAIRLQRRIGLIPREGLGVARRAILLALFTWLPIAVWGFILRRTSEGAVGESLLSHFDIHARCLIAIPCFVIAEGVGAALVPRLLALFKMGGIVTPADEPRFNQILADTARLRDRTLAWVLIGVAIVAGVAFGPWAYGDEPLRWAAEVTANGDRIGFGGWWYLLVVRPLFMALCFAWLWRLVLMCVLFYRIAQLPLSFVPTHPDRAGGIGFIERSLTMFSPVVFGLSAVAASSFAHEILFHGGTVTALRLPMTAVAVVLSIIFLLPMLCFMKALGAAKRRAEAEYGALVANHGRAVRRRWIEGDHTAPPAMLDAPELGATADVMVLYTSAKSMRPVPLSKRGIATIVAPAALPMLVAAATQVPIKSILLKVLGSLV